MGMHKCIGLPFIEIPTLPNISDLQGLHEEMMEQMKNTFPNITLPDQLPDGLPDALPEGEEGLPDELPAIPKGFNPWGGRRLTEVDCDLMCRLDACIDTARIESNVDPSKRVSDGYSCFTGSSMEDLESLAYMGCLCDVNSTAMLAVIVSSLFLPVCGLCCCLLAISGFILWHGEKRARLTAEARLDAIRKEGNVIP